MTPAVRVLSPASLLRPAILLLAILSGSLPAAADVQNPNQDRGFSPEKAFEIGQLDNVNLFNGALVVTIPLGLTYPLDGGLSYGLTLVYNSNVWEWEELCPPQQSCRVHSVPNPESNAGLGWTLTLGRLFAPHTPPANSSARWLYLGADGADHLFYGTLHRDDPVDAALYTRDGSYLRLKGAGGASPEIEFPDGTVHRFNAAGELEEIRGPFTDLLGQPRSWLRISRGTVGGLPVWTLSDSAGRSHTVRFGLFAFGDDPSGSGNALVPLVTEVELAAFGGTRATYSFSYQQSTFLRPKADFSQPDELVTVQHLTGVALPDGSSYSAALADYADEGRLGRLVLPTLGALEWDYRTYTFVAPDVPRFPPNPEPQPDPFNTSRGVRARRLVRQDGVVEGEWSYTQGVLAGELYTRTTVVDPLGHQRRHFFQGDPDNRSYTLPYRSDRSDGTAPGRSLSVEVFEAGSASPVRSTYVRYEWDAEDPPPVPGQTPSADLNRRLASDRTVYHDDGDRFAEVDRSRFDGLGHYRTVTTGGSFGAGNVRTEVTEYNLARGNYNHLGQGSFTMLPASEPWVLGTYGERRSTEAGVTAVEQACFEELTGFLLRRRELTGISPGPHDVLRVFDRDLAGNLVRERHYGADRDVLSTSGDLCTLPLPPQPQYWIDHTWQSGVLASSRYRTPTGGTLGFFHLDRDLDPSTGLPATSRDVSGLATDTEYDRLGRLVWVKPRTGDRDGWTQVLYKTATPAAEARVTVLRRGNGSETAPELARSRVIFDDFGRVFRERQLQANGVWNLRDTRYNAAGLKSSVSEIYDPGQPVFTTRFLDVDPFGRARTVRPPEGAVHDLTIAYTGDRRVERTSKIATSRDPVTGAVVETAVKRTEELDRQGRLWKVTEDSGAGGAGLLTEYAYDVGHRLSEVTQTRSGVTQTRRFTYDRLGFLRSEQHPEKGLFGNGAVSWSDYDALGHAGTKADGTNVLELTYDAAERLTRIAEPGASGRVWKEFTYAPANDLPAGNYRQGKLESATRHNYILPPSGGDLSVTEAYTYAGREGRVSQKETTLGSGNQYLQSLTWDELGHLVSQTYPQCQTGGCADTFPPARTVSATYTHGWLTAVPGWASSITYHPNGMLSEVRHANGVTYSQGKDPLDRRRPASIGVSGPWIGTTVFSFSYDGSGNVVSWLNSAGDGELYLYDRLGRIAEATLGGGAQQSYGYDGFGNLTSLGSRTVAVVPSTNRLSAAGYDDRGNLTAHLGFAYTWDALDRLQSWQGGGNSWIFAYTADGERLLSHDCTTNTSTWRLRGLGGEVLREYELTDNGSCTAGFSFTSQWGWTKDWIYRGGALLASIDSAGQILHYHPDHLGTPRLHTDGFGFSAGNAAYFAYGEPPGAAALAEVPFGDLGTGQEVAPTGEVMRFTGHERDLGTDPGMTDDLDYMHARYYKPMWGRFLSFDPVGGNPRNPQSWNRYAYVLSNPVNFIDPLGLQTMTFRDEITVCASALTGGACNFSRSFFDMALRFNQVNSMHHLPPELRGLSVQQMLEVLPPKPCEGFSCRLLADVASERNTLDALELGVVAVTGEFIGGHAFSLLGRVARAGLGFFGRSLAKRGYILTEHAIQRMGERGVSEAMVDVALSRGTRFWDPANGTVQFVLRDGFIRGDSLLVAIEPSAGKVTTVIKGSRLIRPRFLPLPE